jgi:uncharacterized membrane protein
MSTVRPIPASHLSSQEQGDLARLRKIDPARVVGVSRAPTVAERLADNVAATVGSWNFVITQSIVFTIWVAINVIGWVAAWDPYPFILLNLVLSFQAAYTAPTIMMSQNRQADIDRYRAACDYEINLQAALEVKLLHQKIDSIADQALPGLLSTVQQIEQRLEALQSTFRPGPSAKPQGATAK